MKKGIRVQWRFRWLVLLVCGWLVVALAEARQVRVATWNLEFGAGSAFSPKYEAQKAILQRINADIVAMQELTGPTSNDWTRLAEELGYPYRAWGGYGPFSGNMAVGFFSRYPIEELWQADSPPGAVEITRLPLGVAIKVPGAAQPLALWTVHLKARFSVVDCYRRAIESWRVAADVRRYLAVHPSRTELVVLGDMNDDDLRITQPDRFYHPPKYLSASIRPGNDIVYPLRYQAFPSDVYGTNGLGLFPVPAFRQASGNNHTHLYTDMRLDYIFVSPALWQKSRRAPAGEIYHSQWDRATGGLPKQGRPLPPAQSLAASDHYPVFVDLQLDDAAGGTP